MTSNNISEVKIVDGVNKFKTSPTEVIFGLDSFKRITTYVNKFNSKKIFLVSGQKTIERTSINNYLADYEVITYRINPNPNLRTIENGLNLLNKNKPDLVIGLGGGSVIDTGKAIALLSKNPGPVRSFLLEEKTIENNGLPFMAIPTTSGTGSEVTRYSSLIDEANKQKESLTHTYLCPDIAIVDPKLTLTLPKRITAITGMDALSQGIEAYWSVNAGPESDAYALTTIKLAYENLKGACEQPENIKFRKNMSIASLLSGAAINYTRTTIVHAVSYPLTTFFKVPHGLACSLTLPYFLKYNSGAIPERISNISKAMGTKTPSKAVENLKKLILDIGLETNLSQLGIKEEDIEIIIKNGFRPDRAGNNPREVTAEDLREILMKIL